MNKLTIPKRKYEGYVWYSDKPKPIVLHNEAYKLDQAEGANPFVIEALLYCKDEEVSVSVKHTGRYIIQEYKFSDYNGECTLVQKEYLPHRLGRVEKLKFNQYWKEEEDPLCEGMKTLKLKATIFTGFKYKND